jgi:asparagine synthase (glutamine-hydrolysing)
MEEVAKACGAKFIRSKMSQKSILENYINSEYKSFAQDILLSSSSINRGYFNKNYIENLFNTNSTRNPYASRQIWLLLTFELWNKLYIDNFNTNANTPSIIEQTS